MFSKIIRNVSLMMSLLLIACSVFAADDTLGTLASNITASLDPITKLLTAGAYVGGTAFFIVSVFMFKQHKENPTQVPLSKPMMILAMSSALIFLPSFIGSVSQTIFGGSQSASPEGFQPGTSSQ
ncbi:MAG TPA: type IV secretion protein IcmD [Legionellales bacterium]|nr:type IV secretion protein IcmD [Legionellales bacterium]